MTDSSRVLLVEGAGDKEFFEALLPKLGYIDVGIQVYTPKDLKAETDGKKSVRVELSALIKELKDGRTQHLGVILDADYKTAGGQGTEQTIKDVASTLSVYGYANSPKSVVAEGYVFEHDRLPLIGLWIMSKDNKEGMFEDWLKMAVSQKELPFFQKVLNTVNDIESKRFSAIHQSKAEINTWLAWQKKPSLGIKSVVQDNLIDLDSIAIKMLHQWLQVVFPKETL
jgi:hypothetical protein